MRRGYTLIEMMVVTTVLLLISFIVFPAIGATLRSNQRRAFLRGLENMTLDAHNQAVSTQQNVSIQVDMDGTFTVQSQGTDNQGSVLKSLPSADGLQPSKFVLTSREVANTDWIVNFYPDGTSDAAGIELSDSNSVYSITIDAHQGRGTLATTELPQQSDDRWEAGDYVHRS